MASVGEASSSIRESPDLFPDQQSTRNNIAAIIVMSFRTGMVGRRRGVPVPLSGQPLFLRPCDCLSNVRFTPKADMCGATRDVCYGPEADITELGCHQRLDFTSLIAGFVAPLPSPRSPLSSSKPKQLG
jgi:hypothetical protein